MRLSLAILLTVLSMGVTCDSAFAKKAKSTKSYYDIKDEVVAYEPNDPWESFNKPIFNFNVGFDRHVLKPVITAYDYIPRPVRGSISNFLSNLNEPFNFVHGILRLDPEIAFTSFWRFVLNSSFGLAGLDDFALKNAKLAGMNQSLNNTLAYYGVGSGPYLVIPVIGPSSLRDAPSRVADWFIDPVSYIGEPLVLAGRAVANGIDARDRQAVVIDQLYYDSIDPYSASRSAYRQHEVFKKKTNE